HSSATRLSHPIRTHHPALLSFPTRRSSDLTGHFSSTDPAYLEQLRTAVVKAGSHIVDLGHGGRSFYHPDKAKRQAAIEFGKTEIDRKSTRLNSSHRTISYAVFCLKKKKKIN